jgi:magnesium-transporting ATPase (P-type)
VHVVSTIGTYLLCEVDFLIEFVLQLGMNFDLVRSESVVLHVFPFNSEKKRGGVAVKLVSDLSQGFFFFFFCIVFFNPF